MAGPFDPFAPQSDQSLVPGGIQSFLGDPQSKAALMSIGLALMQPPAFGDNGFSQAARAIGQGGESVRAQEEQDRKDQELAIKESEAQSKQDLRGAQADTSAARSDAATTRLGLARANIDATNERNRLNNRVRLSNLYQNYVKDVAKENQQGSLLTPGYVTKPVLPMQDWINQNPMLRNLGLQEGADTGTDTQHISSPGGSIMPGGEQIIGVGGAYPKADPDPTKRPDGIYDTPRGALRWNSKTQKWSDL